MTHVPHGLAEEFPEHLTRIHDLKTSDAHFAKLADEYHDVNRKIHRVETGVEPASQMRETELRKMRMQIKDEIATMLSAS